MNRIRHLALLSLLLVIGMLSCKPSEMTPTDMPEADSITIWFEGKGITLEKRNSIGDELSVEAVKVINEAGGVCQTYSGYENLSINMLKNRLKCLEITFKPDRRPIRYFGNEVEGVLPFEVSSVLFPLDNKDYAGSVITYDENSQWWILWLSTRSTDELDRMVEKYLEDSD